MWTKEQRAEKIWVNSMTLLYSRSERAFMLHQHSIHAGRSYVGSTDKNNFITK
jgi:hypothetical protein